ncbi:MAG TPA: DoxX family protein [Methylomirabilota bacterium]|nr:DoxX family protein [Methylomirabilota bacterium]
MHKLLGLLQLRFLPHSIDLGLLLLRLTFGIPMALLHGWGKLTGFNQMASQFPDILKIGSKGSLAMAVFGELVCGILLAVGLATRSAAVAAAITMFVAFFIAHRGKLTGPGNGEMAFLYLAAYLVILVAGPGRYSLDAALGKGTSPKRPKPSA